MNHFEDFEAQPLQKSFHITTFGCQMNLHDSEALEGLLLDAGYRSAQGPETADIILFNTCCVRDHAEQRLYSRISQLKELKEKRPDLLIGIGGCVAQKEKEGLLRKFPHVDLVFGPNAVHDIAALVDKTRATQKPLLAVPEDGPAVRSDQYQPNSRPRLRAWVSIMRGCDNYCSYCIVPYVRGRQRSKPFEEVLNEVQKLVSTGVKEITLLGQNVNSYGQDLNSDHTFAHLLERLDKIDGLLRVRFTTSHPKDISEKLMRAISELHSVCEHLHLPAQSGSSRILHLMNRRYTAQEYLSKLERLRQFVPDISLTTDLIVGFPGETEEDFEQTRALLEQAQFDGAYIFKYSPREGTAAARMSGEVPKDIIKRRHGILLSLQKSIAGERLRKLIGATQSVLPEHPDPKRSGHMIGRTRGHRTAAVAAPPAMIGKEVPVRISRIEGWTLIGEESSAQKSTCCN